ncbi:MAG TPA: transporter [Sphingomonadaceae bacterium]|nr:transporter [Sphingomonadaceae bacterium]
MMRVAWALFLAGIAGPAIAGDLRDYCPERPGLNTPACTIDPGHVSIETGLIDWTQDGNAASRTDLFLVGDTLVRVGLTDRVEARIGWTPFGFVRERDRAKGTISRVSRVGDVTLGFKANLAHPDGSGASIALLPYASLPVGRRPIGAGDWGAGLLIPASYELSPTLALALTPEIDAAVDEDGRGRHLAYGGAAGISLKLSEALSSALELSAIRDRDPSGHSSLLLAGASLGWQAEEGLQFDIGANAGLNRDTPNIELMLGVSRRF